MKTYILKLIKMLKTNFPDTVLGFAKWISLGAVMGAVIGLIGTGFHHCVEYATHFREDHSFIIWFLPIAGLAIVSFYSAVGYKNDRGTNLVLLAVRDNEKMGFNHTLSIFVSTIITHLFGGSSGREGAALQIGGSIGSQLGRTFRLDEDDKRILTMCGMSAAFAALFNTPVAAAFFAMEVISVGIFHYSAIVACVISAVVADGISKSFGSVPFSADVVFPEGNAEVYIKILLLIVLCSLLSIFFCISMGAVSIAYKKIKNSYIRAALGGLIVALLTFVVGTYDYNGAGSGVIERAFTEPANPEAFILKIAFTALTLCAGFKGGEIVPVFFVGATFGSFFADIAGLEYSLGAAIGMIALFCGVTNCPIASMLLSIELFGSEGVVFFAIACAVSYVLSGYRGLYSEQTILYSKTKTRFINQKIGDKKHQSK